MLSARLLPAMLVLALVLTACSQSPERTEPRTAFVHVQLGVEAAQLDSFVKSTLAKRFLASIDQLPAVSPRVIYRQEDRSFISADTAAALSEEERSALERKEIDGDHFYTTKYGTPLAYSRVLDIAVAHGLENVSGKRILDFGYGTIGHLRLLASLGAAAVGVDVDSFLVALYSQPGDQGAVDSPNGPSGSVTLVDGRWPSSQDVVTAVGAGYDLFTSKNTLKRGYIHPDQRVDPKYLVRLGVDDKTYLQQLSRILNPGGLAVIYNICPAQDPANYIPWADGRCPFSRADIEQAGFEVLAYDVNDDEATRKMAHLLGWDQGQGAMNLETGLFGHYTVFRRK